ncbi:ATP-binding cassette domain-containing protein [Paenibacillus sp. MWE-103]|uniref:ATP-binding cassette domain-containing protein n=1 Tax=Paenibacillus artemisiicola TaxID=1172618 RepID=A0ABS3WJG5_9BACL|nr:ABC transporter transmembrane domain-containing protein [Paenibacillus artemisiicola]MBO7748469.1 ATP-binding cassette domain-containing protein [Paenibacillus artemisiicola]
MLNRRGVGRDDIVYAMVCDRTTDGRFLDTHLILTGDRLLIAASLEEPATEKTYKGYAAGKPGRHDDSRPGGGAGWSLEEIGLDRIESLAVVNLVASGMIVVRAEEERVVAAFTNGEMGRASRFASAFEKLKKGEPLDELQLHEEHGQAACPKCGMIYPEEGRQVCPKCMKKHAIFARLLSFAGHYRSSIVLIILFMLLNSGTSLVIPYLQGTVLIDQGLGGEGPFAHRIGLIVALIIGFRTLALLFGVLYGVINAKMSANIAFDLKASVFSAMQRLSLSFFQRKQTGQLMTRVNNDATELQYFFVDGMSYFIVNAMNIIGITVVLLALDWKLTLLCYILLPVVVVLVRKSFPRLWRLSWRRHRTISRMNAIISDTIRGTRVVKAFGKEQKEIERFHTANQAYSHADQSFNKFGGTVFPVLNILTQTGGILIWAFGGWMVMGGTISFGKVLTFVSYMHMLYGPIQFMNNIVSWWSYCMSAAQRIFEIQDAVPEVSEKPDAVHLERMRGEIEVANVVFGYEPNKAILKQVSMRAKPGQMIGVVGHSGAGKSTLVNLISRLYDVSEGEVRIDGINVKELSAASLRGNIGIVSQDVYVFSGSIAENIAYADPDCSLEDIIYAASVAHAHDFIMKLPDGYDTIVGTGGHNLSGGEKQRLSIARAVLHNPRILILDEATASLDTETELHIQAALDALVKGRTTIAIAHRLSTLRNADYLLVMDNGKVAESGTHEELMARKGAYFDLVKKHDEALKMNEVISA